MILKNGEKIKANKSNIKLGGEYKFVMDDKYLVTKSNPLIVSHYSLSLVEQKIILILASMVQPNDKEFRLYKFKIADFIKLLGLNGDSSYTQIPIITKKLMQKVLEIKEEGRTLQLNWLSSADYRYGEGTIELELSEKLKPYLLEIKEFFTTYRLKNILALNCKYSIRIYEILKANEYKKTVEIKFTELQNMLKLSSSYSTYEHFKSRIIKPAQEELAEKTDIEFDYLPIKTGKKITALKFTIKPNLKNKQVLELEESPKIKTKGKLWNSDIADDLKADVQTIQSEFQKRYKGELLDKFVEEMLVEKGYQNVRKCIGDYENYIQGRDIRNISGDFYRFVMDGYQKPIRYKGNKLQRDNFEQREYSREELEKYYYDFTKDIDKDIDIENKTVKDKPELKTEEDNKLEIILEPQKKEKPKYVLESIMDIFKKRK